MRVDEVARDVVAGVASQAGILLASRWVTLRYQQMCGLRRFRHLRRIGELSVPADVSTGVVTVTQGSRTVTGDAAAQAAWDTAVDWIGSGRAYLRAGTVWHRIEGRQGADLRLLTAYSESTAASAGYTIVPRFHRVDAQARHLGAFLHPRRRRPLVTMSLMQLDQREPRRSGAPQAGPAVAVEVEPDADGVRLVELYPYCTEPELIAYVFYLNPPALRRSDTLPPAIDPHILREGALIDAMRFEAARAAQADNTNAAGYWRNESRAQETRWETYMRDAAASDVGADDVEFLLESRYAEIGTGDIVTAEDQVWSRY